MNWYKLSKVIKLSSISLYIKGYERDDRFNNLLNLSYYLNGEIWSKYLGDNLSRNYFREFPSVSADMVITPDGDDYSKVVGIINFYIGGIIPSKVKPILYMIIGYLESNEVKVGKVVEEKSNMYEGNVIRIPVIENSKGVKGLGSDSPPDINMSNGNAFFIFNKVLGYNRDLWDDGVFGVSELKRRIGYYRGEDRLPEGGENQEAKLMDSEGLEEFLGNVDDLSGRSGKSSYSEEDIRRRLGEIEGVCDWAIMNGYGEIYLA